MTSSSIGLLNIIQQCVELSGAFGRRCEETNFPGHEWQGLVFALRYAVREHLRGAEAAL